MFSGCPSLCKQACSDGVILDSLTGLSLSSSLLMTQLAIFPLPEAAVALLDTAYNYTVATVKVLIWQLNKIPTIDYFENSMY